MPACPCNSDRDFDQCCGPVIAGTRPAATATELMRSRYCAFATGAIDYLGSSHDPETREQFDPQQATEWSSKAEWHGFEILRTDRGTQGDSTGTVEFIARYSIQGNDVAHHEIAEFRQVDGRWYFRDGREVPVTVRRDTPKVGRNDPCPCGSG
ncbi:MAG: YchJ family protein, partial [Planctomycetes bacterium]|nr:YchJ family protein [Planctomycetota bacterium]